MGSFDEVSVFCPKCGCGKLVQSKAGMCNFDQWSVYKAPLEVIADVSSNSPYKCESCGHNIRVLVQHMVAVT